MSGHPDVTKLSLGVAVYYQKLVLMRKAIAAPDSVRRSMIVVVENQEWLQTRETGNT
jgi:hypothetical protein